jgi:hypothetical protein
VEEAEAPAPAAATSPEIEEARPFGEQRRKRSWFEDAVQAVREAVHEATHSSDAHNEVSAEAPPEPVLSAGSDTGHELISSPSDSRSSHAVSSHKDPALEEPVPVHVTPEPMLVKEESATAHSDYAIRQELAPAVHSFLPPAIEEPAPEPEPVLAHFEPESHEFSPGAFTERIPTAPPPNPQALSDIPFLNATAHLNNEAVDAVVQRVLERLEPQLHELLSKGVLKPLVENLLQDELAKREK